MVSISSKEELIPIILSGIEGTYDIGPYIDRRQKLDQDSSDSSIISIIAEIEGVTSHDFEYSDWYEPDDIPDYSGILSSFTALLESKRYTNMVHTENRPHHSGFKKSRINGITSSGKLCAPKSNRAPMRLTSGSGEYLLHHLLDVLFLMNMILVILHT